MASPTRNGRDSSSTIPAKMFDSDCCAAMPSSTLVSAVPTSSWRTCTPNSCSVIRMITKTPTSSTA
jgi:hypothetical protein